MRGTLNTSTLEAKFPLLAVENDCILSKNADLTAAFRVTLPELFTVTGPEYEAIHGAWLKALKVLPPHTVVHKQDRFIEEHYAPPADGGERSFLSRAFERHFNERPYLRHTCCLFVTMTTKEQMRRQSDFSTLCRGVIIPKQIRDAEAVARFLDAVGQMERILNDSGLVTVERLTADEIVGTAEDAGLLARYFALSDERQPVVNEDIRLDAGGMRIGDKYLCLHTLSDLDYLPLTVETDSRYERLSTDRSDCRLSFAAPAGLLLGCSHLYNQYIFIEDSDEVLRQLEAAARNMTSLANYSRSNAINKEWIDLYLNEAHSQGLQAVRCHCNVVTWSEDVAELKRIRNEVGAQLAAMGCTPHHNTVDVPVLFWAGIPGNEADFPAEETFCTFLDHALCLFNEETSYRSSLSPFGIRMVDRMSGIPLHLDISDLPMKKGITTNRNKFILGPSGSGKSFFTNHIVRQYYEQGAHIVLVDTGNSYLGLCNLIHRKTEGEDGIYFTYTEESPIAFNPFFTEDGVYDIEKRESIKTLILTLWKRDDEAPKRSEEVALSNAVNLYLSKLKSDPDIAPSFNTFYEFVTTDYRHLLEQKRVREKDFDLENFLNVLEPYYRGGEYDYLLNSDKQPDLLSKRFIVFELDNIADNKVLYPVVTIIIMETFINKMRRLKGIRKVLLLEEAWKAIAKEGMAGYVKYLFKTVRKYFGEAVVVTQEVDDIISSPIVKESIINNADCKILLDQRKYANKFDGIQTLLGLTEKEKSQILSINLSNDPRRLYKEVWIGLGGVLVTAMLQMLSTADNLHRMLRLLYEDMIVLCQPMTTVASAIAGIGALLYIAYRVWQSLAQAEPIDFFPLLRPFVIGLCILFFQPLVLGTLNGILSPLVQATHSLMVGQTLDMNAWQQQKRDLEAQSRDRFPADSYYTEDAEMERRLAELGMDEATQTTLDNMNRERSSWSVKGMIMKAVAWLLELLFSAALSCVFLVVLWLIFRPTAEPQPEGAGGINITVPDGREQVIEGNKQKAVERLRSEEAQNKRLSTLGDNSFSLLDDGLKSAEEAPAENPAQRAEAANRAMQAQMQDFYRTPPRNAEVEALKEQVEALQSQLDAERRQPDALELAEQQYRLAQKYLGSGEDSSEPEQKRDKSRKSVMRPLRAGDLRASTLNPDADVAAERNVGFITAAGTATSAAGPAVRACVAETQVVRVGGMVRLRLLEPVRIDGIVVPRNTPLYGMATLGGSRLQVVVSSIEYEGHIFTVEAAAYDIDGQPGLNVPDSKERTAIKEALASIGQTAGTSINVTRSAGQQIVSDLSQGAIQASSRYASEKLKEIKVTLKANHQVLLISKEQ